MGLRRADPNHPTHGVSNRPGTRAAIRAYWSNNSFTANVVDDTPHESRLEPHQWGTATVE